MAIQLKTCKQCNETYAVGMVFKPSNNSDDGWFPLCRYCIEWNEHKQVSRWEYLMNKQ